MANGCTSRLVGMALGLLTAGCDTSLPARFSAGNDDCATVFPDRISRPADVSCRRGGCTVTVEQLGCVVVVTSASCDFGPLRASVDVEGELAFEPAPFGHCEPTSAPEGADWSLGCDQGVLRCQLDVYPAVSPAVYEAETFPLLDPPVAGVPESRVSVSYLGEGYLAGAVVSGAKIWVASRGGAYVPLCAEVGVHPSELVIFDPFEARPVGRRPAPDCLRSLVRDPAGDGFVGLYAGGAHWRIGRFDGAGMLVASSSVAPLAPGRARAIVAGPAGELIVVDNRSESENRGRLVLVSAADLRVRGEVIFPESFARPSTYVTAVSFRSRTLAVFNFRASYLEIMDWPDGEIVRSFRMEDVDRPTLDGDVRFGVSFEEELLVWSGYEDPAVVFVTDDMRVRGAVTFYEGSAQLQALALDPFDSRWLAVGVRLSGGSARVARLDPQAARFLPGSVPVGQGVVSQFLVDGAGALWAVLPDSGTLVRLRPNME